MFMKNHVGISILDDMSPMDPLKNMLELQPTDLITIWLDLLKMLGKKSKKYFPKWYFRMVESKKSPKQKTTNPS